MNEVTALFLRRMQAPLLLIVFVYSISIIGLLIIPGVDENGNSVRMSILHAFYFVSYTATTIGFGEIPYPLTEAQRLWSIAIIYMTVISWFYALGTVITLFQDKLFIKERQKQKFKRHVRNMDRPYYVVCGFGETGRAVIRALQKEHFGAVVIEIMENLSERQLDTSLEYIPSLTADASDPSSLELANVNDNRCRGVIAVTASDEVNLQIAIISKLLHPDVKVICRSDNKEHEDNMRSFGTEHIINPYESFAEILDMALKSPALHLIYDWLTGAPDTTLGTPLKINHGHWILSGYGRFGRQIHSVLKKHNIDTVIIDPDKKLTKYFDSARSRDRFIVGTGTDAATLEQAGIYDAGGVIAGSDNDANNLSMIMTARQLRADVFVVGRQNLEKNHRLYRKINDYCIEQKRLQQDDLNSVAHLSMQPSEIIARKIRALLIAPLLIDFIEQAALMSEEWANITISRLSAIIGDNRPYIWMIELNKYHAPAIAQAMGYGRHITLDHIMRDPREHNEQLKCVPLLLKRGDHIMLLPDDTTELKALDQVLFCGQRKVKIRMMPTLNDIHRLNYAMSLEYEPETYIWKQLHRLFRHLDRRTDSR